MVRLIRPRKPVEMIAQDRVHRNIEQRAGLLLAQPNRRTRILRPCHPENICRPLRRELQEQEGRRHVWVFGAGGLDPSRNFFIGPDPIARPARFQAQPGGLVRRNDAVISGELEQVLEDRGRLAPLKAPCCSSR